jgi:hypothetical protein
MVASLASNSPTVSTVILPLEADQVSAHAGPIGDDRAGVAVERERCEIVRCSTSAVTLEPPAAGRNRNAPCPAPVLP